MSVATTQVAAQSHAQHSEDTGIWSWITTVDHKRIGIMYFVTTLFFFLIGGAEALLIRVQLFRAEMDLIPPEVFNQLFTMHGTTMIFLVAMPMAVAFFNFVVPLQIGARDVAFPRLNAFSYWVYLIGGLYLTSSFFFGAPNASWVGYAPLTSVRFNPGVNTDFWVVGISILGISSVAGGINFITTIIQLRAPGLRLMRMPLFSWMTLVTSFLLITALPVIAVALVLLGFDRFWGSTFFVPEMGGDPVLWQHLFWIFGHPEVYILVIPSFGILSDVVPTFSKKPLFGYPVVVYAGALIALVGWGVWSHHMFTVGLGPIADSFFVAATMIIAIPTGVKIFNWLATMWGGQLTFPSAMLWATGAIAVFTVGGLSGIMHAAAPIVLHQHDSYFVVAHFHYVILGGAIFGLFTGLYYWYPKATGRLMNETLGKWHFWLTMIGFNLTFFPMHISGLLGMPRRIVTYSTEMNVELPNQLSTIGAFIFGIGTLVMIYNVFRSAKRGQIAGPNPWGAATLEFALPSPPKHYNYPELPEIRMRDPLWNEEERARLEASVQAVPEKEPVMPNSSFWPIVLASVVAGTWITTQFSIWWLSAAGLLLTIATVAMWAFEPAFDE